MLRNKHQHYKINNTPPDLEFGSSPLYNLPPSPNKWDSEVEQDEFDLGKDLFFLKDENKHWNISEIKKLRPTEKPEIYIREFRKLKDSFLLVDKTGKNPKFQNTPSSLLNLNDDTKQINEIGLQWDIYKINSNPNSNYLICLSSNSIFHAYDENLKLIFSHDLNDDTRIQRILESNLVLWGELRTKIKSFDISPDGRRFLFSIADTAYFEEIGSSSIWGASIPLKTGWERIYDKPEVFSQKPEILDALKLLKLDFPLSQEDIKRKYRELALQYHPDLNPNNPSAMDLMKSINNAFELLTGIDPKTISIDPNKKILTYKKIENKPDFQAGNMSISISPDYPGGLDWIYAGCCSFDNSSVYLGTYSGKVIKVDSSGKVIYRLNVGNVVLGLFDNKDFLYIFTSTRLYVLDDKVRIIEIIDISSLGKSVLYKDGIVFQNEKNMSVFSNDGKRLFEIYSKNPIRRVLWIDKEVKVQTRTDQVEIKMN